MSLAIFQALPAFLQGGIPMTAKLEITHKESWKVTLLNRMTRYHVEASGKVLGYIIGRAHVGGCDWSLYIRGFLFNEGTDETTHQRLSSTRLGACFAFNYFSYVTHFSKSTRDN